MAGKALVIRAEGSPYELGLEHGRAARELILQLARENLPREMAAMGHEKAGTETVKEKGLEYKPFIEAKAPHLLEEIRGIADGAGLEFEEALALQCRSELVNRKKPPEVKSTLECTSFAISRDRSATGEVMVGQNLDLAPTFDPFGVILCFRPKTGPAFVTWTLAGTVGQVGVNSDGLARCGNFLLSAGWRPGLPTTILWRLMLEQPTVAGVEKLLVGSHRAKSNNFIVGEAGGTIADFESTVDTYRRLEPEDGVLLHTNHYLHPDLLPLEGQTVRLPDTQHRLARLRELVGQLSGEKIGPEDMKTFLRDHEGRPACLCKHEGYSKTVVSVIAHPKAGTIEICPGNPCEGEYVSYRL